MAIIALNVTTGDILKRKARGRIPRAWNGSAYMTFEGAVISEQNVTFAIVVVKPHVVDNATEANRAIVSFCPVFHGLPVVLMGQDGFGRPKYYGRPDIVNFLAHVPLQAISWRKYELN